MRLPPLTLVIGGAASGKSAVAEALIRQSGLDKIYIATAQAFDDEMSKKISAHRADRAAHGWTTLEEPIAIAPLLTNRTGSDAVLLDCLTLWLSNLMISEQDWAVHLEALCDALGNTNGPVVLVSNEVGHGIVPDTSLGRAFRNAQGKVNQRMARLADSVIQVTVGLPHVLKGPPLAEGFEPT